MFHKIALWVPFVIMASIFWGTGRFAFWLWFYHRTRKRVAQRFLESGVRDYKFVGQWNRVDFRVVVLQFWKPCKSFIKDWGFLEVTLLDPNGDRVSAEKLANYWLKPQPGWKALLLQLCATLLTLEGFDGHIRSIRQKYGVLVFNVGPLTPKPVLDVIYAAIEESARTCDQCGERGWGFQLKSGLATRCSEHQKETQGAK